MADRPIIFSAPMIQALLDGRKTMTRRLAWRVSINEGGVVYDAGGGQMDYVEPHEVRRPSPWQRVQPGDRLWVRETCADQHPLAIQSGRYSQPGRAGIPGPPGVTYRTIYRADGEPLQIWRNESGNHPYYTRSGPADEIASRHPAITSNFERGGVGIYWTPSIHMPRWASRLTVIVTATKIERLQDISYVDAHREGVEDMNALGTGAPRWRDYEGTGASAWFFDSRQSFASLWRSLHGADAWDANPEVVALTFRVVRANIDSAEARAA